MFRKFIASRGAAVVVVGILVAACSGSTATASPTAQATQVASGLPSTAPSAAASTAPSAAASAGEYLTLLTDWSGSDQSLIQPVVAEFTKETGIPVQVEGSADFDTVLRTRVAAGDLPMVAIVPRPGFFADFARAGLLKSLDSLGVPDLATNYQQAWVDLGTVDGKQYAITVKANSKSQIWYKPTDLTAIGAQVPATMDEFKAILTKMATGGHKPLAVSGKDIWTVGDWFENIYLRTAGPQKYQDLFAGKLPFTDASVVNALTIMDGIIGNEAWIYGGRSIALSTGFGDALALVFGTGAKSNFYMEGGFAGTTVTQTVNTKLKEGTDINFFPFPAIDPQYSQNAVVGGGDFAIAFSDNDATKKFMTFLTTATAANIWATQSVISPNKDLDVTKFASLDVQNEAKQLQAAQTFVFDGTDVMPGTLGDPDWNTLCQTVLGDASIVQDPAKLNSLLSDFQKDADTQFGH
jgi:alpha-glucoside transport system substrate-binding protein